MNKGLTVLLFVTLSITMLSCEKNVLDKSPLGEISEDLLWKDINLANLYVNNIYTGIPGGLSRGLDCATEIGEEGHNWGPSQNFDD